MNPTASLVNSQPFLTSDVAGVVMFVIALIYGLMWWRDRDPGMGWFTLGWFGIAVAIAGTPYQPLAKPTIEWSAWWPVLHTSLAALTIGLIDFLPLPEDRRRRTLLWALLPLAVWFVVYSLPLWGLQIPRSLANLPGAAWYGAMGAVTWWASRREAGAGHRVVAASFLAIVLCGIGLALAQVDAPLLRFWALLPILILALTLMPATLLRRRRLLEAEVERRRAAETEVRSLNAALEARVEQRTAELQALNAELLATRDAALARHQALLAAQQAEARYRRLADWTPEVITVHRDGILLYANPATATLLGMASPEGLVGQSLLQFVPPSERAFVFERIERVQRGEPGQLIELPFSRLDGTRIEVETISILIEFDGQAAVYSWGRDITQRRAAERQAERLSGFYAALSRTGEAVVRMLDEQSLFEALCRICVERGQALRANVLSIDGDEVWQRASAGRTDVFDPAVYLNRYRPTERPWLLTSQAILSGRALVCADYSTDPRTQVARSHGYGVGFRSQAVLPLRRGGRVCGALLLFAAEAGVFDEPIVELLLRMTAEVSFALDRFDLDQARLRALEEAEAGRDRFARVFHSAAMIATISEVADGTIVDINETACQHYGLRRADVIGRTLPSMGLGISAEARQSLFARLASEGRVSNAEIAFTTKSGAQLTLLVCGECIDWEGKQRLLLLANDITEVRTADRAQEKMRGAERANEAKTEFISRMSHELRTPLNAVLGFAELLGEPGEPMTPRQRAHLQRLQGGALHLQALVDDLIDIASIEAGRLKVTPVPVELDAVVASSIALCAAAAAQARVKVVIEGVHDDRGLLAMADPTRLRQVLANLVSNGIKYNRPGGHVIVRIEGFGPRVVVDVTDDGLGMTDEQQERLFTPYDRLGREGSGVAGTGIGLVLARQLVELMGGRLDVRSVAGQGTQLRVELPRADAGHPTPGFGETLSGARLEGTGLVLYIEDEPVNRLLVQQALESCSGLELITAEDGATALVLACERRPDLVLMDMHLPDMNGLQVMAALHADPATSGVPVVMLSASALAQDVDFARASGAVEYWTKPVNLKQLRADVRRLLGVSVQSDEA